MVADIAYRMAILNPHLLENVIQETKGIVLIDEIDMHLNPAWQRKIISALHKTFPKVQFICTTHSPTVLTNVPRENIQILDNGKIYRPNVKTYGRDVNSKNPDHISMISYKTDGTIFCPDNKEFDRDLNKVLNWVLKK